MTGGSNEISTILDCYESMTRKSIPPCLVLDAVQTQSD